MTAEGVASYRASKAREAASKAAGTGYYAHRGGGGGTAAKKVEYFYNPKTGHYTYQVGGGKPSGSGWQSVGTTQPKGYVGGQTLGVATDVSKRVSDVSGKGNGESKYYYDPITKVSTTRRIEGQRPMTKTEVLGVIKNLPREQKVEYAQQYGEYTKAKEGVAAQQRQDITALAEPISLREALAPPIQERAMITAAPPKPLLWKETPEYFKEKAGRFEFKALKTTGVKGQLYQAGAFGLGVAAGFTYPIRHPVSFVKGVYTFGKGLVTKPFETGATLKEELTFRPASFIGEMVGVSAFGKVAPKVAKPITAKLPKPKVAIFRVPTKKADVTLYKGVGIEYGTKGKPLVGIAEGKLKFGLKPVDITKAKKPFVVETPIQTAIFQKSLAKAAKPIEVTKFKGLIEITRVTEKTPSKFVQKAFIKETKALSPKGVGEVLKFAKKEKAQVYGSFAARQQMPKELARVSADIDVQLKSDAASSALKTSQLVSKLKKIGEPVRVSKTTPTLIEVKVGKEWHHAVDIHAFEQAMAEASPAIGGEKIFGLQLGQKPIKIKGIETMRLSEQGVRKMGSIATARPGKTITLAPELHRIKDIPDWFAAQETLLRSKFLPQPVRLAQLQKLKTLYPAEIFKQPTIAQPKVLIYSPKVYIPKVQTFPSIAIYPTIPIKGIGRVIPISPPVSKPISPPKAVKYPSVKVSQMVKLSPPSMPVYAKPSPVKVVSPYKYPYKPSPYRPYVSPPSPYKPSPYKPSPYKPLPSPSPYKVPSPKPYYPRPSPYKPSPYPYPYPSPYPYPKPKPPVPIPKPIMYFPTKPVTQFTKKYLLKKKKREFKYQPSLIAGMEKITSIKIPKRLTGLGIRPVVRF